jgi:GNAT superfamily N-acetyltransferase
MIQTSSLQVICRPALAGDRADVIEFCKGIWDGGDYIHEVWDDWFNDPNGILGVAEINGHAVACSKISLLAKGQWWLEGFRVDPKVQGHKVGSRIHRYVTDWWTEHGDGTLRLMTSAENLAVHHVCQKTGFVKTQEVRAYKAAPIPEPTESFSPVDNLSEAAAFAVSSGSIQTTNGLIDLGWRIASPDEHVFEMYSNEDAGFVHKFYWWKEKQGLFSAWIDQDDEKRTLVLGVVACSLEVLPALLRDIRRFAAQEKFDSIFQIAFDMPPIVSLFEQAGFEKHWKESNAFIFEKKHP